jgi:hypothetical protein
MPRVLAGSQGGGRFLMREILLYHLIARAHPPACLSFQQGSAFDKRHPHHPHLRASAPRSTGISFQPPLQTGTGGTRAIVCVRVCVRVRVRVRVCVCVWERGRERERGEYTVEVVTLSKGSEKRGMSRGRGCTRHTPNSRPAA